MRQLSCKEVQRIIPDFLGEGLRGHDIVRFVEHIKSCPSCKEELSIQYLSSEGISHLETGTSFNLEKELTGYMDRALKYRQRKLQRRAALVIYETLALLIITVIFLYTGG
ncbi:MAG: zf-HC2 domain-containing protein [Lachnospiraceae bacterium]|nr:zf-HC2 domain-containing protein [Lachnospiraceae bacterium]